MHGNRTHRNLALPAVLLILLAAAPAVRADRALPEEPDAGRLFDLLRGVSPLPGDLRAKDVRRARAGSTDGGTPSGAIPLDRLLGSPRRLYAGSDQTLKIRVSGPLGTVISPSPNAPCPAVQRDWRLVIDALVKGGVDGEEVKPSLLRIRKDPVAAEDSRTSFLAGLVSFARGEREGAVEGFAAAARASEKDLPARMFLGLMLLASDDPEAALVPLEEAAKLAPRNGTVRELLAEAQIALGRLPAAIRNLEAAVKGDPKAAEARLLLARCLLSTRRPQDALRHLEMLADLQALRFRVEVLTARALVRTGRAGEAVEHALRAEALRPDQIGPRIVRFTALLSAERQDEAEALATEVAKAFPDAPAAWWASTLAAERRGDHEAAEKAARRWVSVSDGGVQATLALARILIAAGKPDDAVPLLDGLLERDPKLAAPHRWLGMAHLAASRHEEARRELEAFLAAVRAGAAADEARRALESLPNGPK